MSPLATHECPQKISAQSVQSFGQLYATYLYTNVLFYYMDIQIYTYIHRYIHIYIKIDIIYYRILKTNIYRKKDYG